MICSTQQKQQVEKQKHVKTSSNGSVRKAHTVCERGHSSVKAAQSAGILPDNVRNSPGKKYGWLPNQNVINLFGAKRDQKSQGTASKTEKVGPQKPPVTVGCVNAKAAFTQEYERVRGSGGCPKEFFLKFLQGIKEKDIFVHSSVQTLAIVRLGQCSAPYNLGKYRGRDLCLVHGSISFENASEFQEFSSRLVYEGFAVLESSDDGTVQEVVFKKTFSA